MISKWPVEHGQELHFKANSSYGHGLQTPRESFFFKNPKLGRYRQIGTKILGAFGVFLADLPVLTLVLLVPCPCFPLINYYFYKKLCLYIQIQKFNWEWELNFGRKELGF